jgi:DNA-directed RNA polymerase subunit RPC12/RpoP
VNGRTWEVEHGCPQCGAPVILEETDRLFQCPFCRVRLYLSTRDYLHYYLSPQNIDVEDLVYVPYWRFKGIVFFLESLQVGSKFSDATALATGFKYFPSTLGLRPQALRLKFMTPKMKGIFLSYTVSVDEAFNLDVLDKALIGESTSLIYSPFIVKGKDISDVFTGKVIGGLPENKLDVFSGKIKKEDWQAHYLAMLCPACGWNLEGERDSCALICKNCSSLWQPSVNGFDRLGFASVKDTGDDMVYLPFWRIKADIDRLELKTYADLIQLANLPKAIRDAWHGTDLFFWVPAFKVRPELFLRIGRMVTISENKGSLEEGFPSGGYLHPVTLQASEAGESLKIIIAEIVINKKKIFPLLKDVNIRIENHLLVYLPFSHTRDELYNPTMRLTINKNALLFGRNL